MAKIKELLTKKIRNRYRLIIRNDMSLEERISVGLTPLNLILLVSGAFVLIATFVVLIFFFTPAKEWIPGYEKASDDWQLQALHHKIDSLEWQVHYFGQRDDNLMRLLRGEEAPNDNPEGLQGNDTAAQLTGSAIGEDEQKFREEQEEKGMRLVSGGGDVELNYSFFTPLKGFISDTFSHVKDHRALDIVAYNNASVKAVLDGNVVFSSWTPEAGHVIIIQHNDNLLSVYKHNSVLLKKEGNFVRAGEVIALVGNSGEITTGPHLHFELWYNGTPLDPRDYILF